MLARASLLFLFASPCQGWTCRANGQAVGSKILVIAVDETNITAVNTERDIIVIDTGGTPSSALRARRTIEERFPGKAFAYVINTHGDGDHTFGNQVFDDALIVGHVWCEEWMRRITDSEQFKARLPCLQPIKDFKPTFPEMTFTDRMSCIWENSGTSCNGAYCFTIRRRQKGGVPR